MPLSDQDVTQVMDWLGRPQPLGQKQLALATATGGAPSGGPVTPGGGVVTPTAPGAQPSAAGGGTRGGASPLRQALSVADLVRKAEGLIPSGAGADDVGLAGEAGVPLAGPGAEAATAAETAAGADVGLAAEQGVALAGPAAEAGATSAESATSSLPGVGQALGFASSLFGAFTAQQDWQKAIHALDAALFASGVGAPVAVFDEAVMGVMNLFGLGGGQHTKGSTIHLPGVSPEGVTTRTEGGTHTVYKSYGEGVGAANAFLPGLSEVKSLEDLATLMNANPQPGRFNVLGGQGDAHRSNRAQEGSPPFTVEDLKNPEFVKSIWVQAGMMGAPADRPDIADAIRFTISRLTPETATPPGEAAPPVSGAPEFLPGPGMTPGGPAGALGFSRDMLQAA